MIDRTIYGSAREVKQAIQSNMNDSEHHPVLICNSHITGLAVARALGKKGIPVLGLDRETGGVAFASKYVSVRGICPNPEIAEKALVQFLLDIGPAFKKKCILSPSMDEWALVLAKYADQLSDYYIWPYADYETILNILDKSRLYENAAAQGVPVPKYEVITEDNRDWIAEEFSYPFMLKPVDKRAFYDRFQEGLFIAESKEDYHEKVEKAGELTLIAQEQIKAPAGGFVTITMYMDPHQQVRGLFAGRRLEIYPAGAGTTCLVESVEEPALAERAVDVLKQFKYHGIAECEFMLDPRDGEYKLIDLNTRPWKWIGLPVHCGVNLPYLLYCDAVGDPFTADKGALSTKWVYLKDYKKLKQNHEGLYDGDALTKEEWLDVLTGKTDESRLITAAVESQDDPEPAYQQLQNEFSEGTYYCPC